MTQYVNPNLIKLALSKVRKSTNFFYNKAIARNKRKQVKHPPLINLLDFMNNRTFTEEEKERVVVEYWEKVAKDPNMEKEIAKQFKIKYDKKYKDNI